MSWESRILAVNPLSFPFLFLVYMAVSGVASNQVVFPSASQYLQFPLLSIFPTKITSIERSSKRQKLTPEPDYDGDSQMASSPESSLPGTRTPTTSNPAYANTSTPAQAATGMGELSPPGSQQQAHRTAGGRTMSGGGGVELAAASGSQQKQQQSQQRRPGETWMNKRAEDEYHRAMESVVDKDFSLSKLAGVLRFQLSCLGYWRLTVSRGIRRPV